MGKLAHGHSVLVGQLLAIELLSAGALAEGFKAEDPNIVGAQRADELIDIGVETIDGRGDEDHRGDADGDAENGEGGAQFIFAQGVQRHSDGFFRVTDAHG